MLHFIIYIFSEGETSSNKLISSWNILKNEHFLEKAHGALVGYHVLPFF